MWAYESVFYQIYPIGFCGAPRVNDGVTVPRIRKVSDWAEHIASLGCNAVYFSPIFESDSHGYDTRDFRKVDCRLGTNEDFAAVCKTLHKHGIKVVLDGVFNHVGRGFWAFKDVQEKKWDSPYKDWFHISFDGNSNYNDGFWYEGWEGHFELVKLNLHHPDVQHHIFECIRQWKDEFGIDGLRLDVAYCLDKEFVRTLRGFCDSLSPDFFLVGELLHGDYNQFVGDGMLHSCTNYECYKGLYSSMNSYNLFEITHSLLRQFGPENWTLYKGKHLLSFVDNHDVDRLMSKLNNKDHIREVYTLLYTLPGIPSIYYGSEWGIEGRKQGASDDAMRPQLDLEKMQKENPHPELTAHIAALGKMRKENPVLADGKYRELVLTNRQYAYARIKDQDAIVVAANNDENPADMSIPVPVDGTYENAFTKEAVPVVDGRLQVHLDACESKVFRKK